MDSFFATSPEMYDCVSKAAKAGVANHSTVGESSKAQKKGKKRNKHKSANLEPWPVKVATTNPQEVALNVFDSYWIAQLNTSYINKWEEWRG